MMTTTRSPFSCTRVALVVTVVDVQWPPGVQLPVSLSPEYTGTKYATPTSARLQSTAAVESTNGSGSRLMTRG